MDNKPFESSCVLRFIFGQFFGSPSSRLFGCRMWRFHGILTFSWFSSFDTRAFVIEPVPTEQSSFASEDLSKLYLLACDWVQLQLTVRTTLHTSTASMLQAFTKRKKCRSYFSPLSGPFSSSFAMIPITHDLYTGFCQVIMLDFLFHNGYW